MVRTVYKREREKGIFNLIEIENNTSDPDLMIVYDGLPHNYISLDGYNPWQIKLTEIT
jgi:hypothetical protein